MHGILGIDPGISGGIAFLDADGFLEWGVRTPIIQGKKREYDVRGMRATLTRAASASDSLLVTIEKVHTLPRDGRVGAFNFGCGYGLWLGLLTGLEIPYMEVGPQRWQAAMLAGLPRGPHTKTSAVRAAKSLFPTIPVQVKADWGIADAALIAGYGRRQHLGGKR